MVGGAQTSHCCPRRVRVCQTGLGSCWLAPRSWRWPGHLWPPGAGRERLSLRLTPSPRRFWVARRRRPGVGSFWPAAQPHCIQGGGRHRRPAALVGSRAEEGGAAFGVGCAALNARAAVPRLAGGSDGRCTARCRGCVSPTIRTCRSGARRRGPPGTAAGWLLFPSLGIPGRRQSPPRLWLLGSAAGAEGSVPSTDDDGPRLLHSSRLSSGRLRAAWLPLLLLPTLGARLCARDAPFVSQALVKQDSVHALFTGRVRPGAFRGPYPQGSDRTGCRGSLSLMN